MLEAAPGAAGAAAAPTSVIAAPVAMTVQEEQSKAAILDLVHAIKGATNIQDLIQLPVQQISAADPHVGLLYLFRWDPQPPHLQPPLASDFLPFTTVCLPGTTGRCRADHTSSLQSHLSPVAPIPLSLGLSTLVLFLLPPQALQSG
jgi:hypothetical protein